MTDSSITSTGSTGSKKMLASNSLGITSLLTFVILVLAWIVGFASRLFAVIRFESIIHEFDPWLVLIYPFLIFVLFYFLFFTSITEIILLFCRNFKKVGLWLFKKIYSWLSANCYNLNDSLIRRISVLLGRLLHNYTWFFVGSNLKIGRVKDGYIYRKIWNFFKEQFNLIMLYFIEYQVQLSVNTLYGWTWLL